jgi:fluoride exporter
MSLPLLIGVGVLGGLGGIARFRLDGRVSERVGREFPYGTLVVNMVGAFVLGLLVGLVLDSAADALAGTGLVGGFTTFSTWTLESHRLGEDGRLRVGALNFAASLVVGVGAAWAGRKLGVRL